LPPPTPAQLCAASTPSRSDVWPRDHPSRPEWLDSSADTSRCSFRSARVYHSAAIPKADSSPFDFQDLSLKGHTTVEPCQNTTQVLMSSFPAGSCPKGHSPSFSWSSSVFIRLLYRKAHKSFSFFPLRDSYGTTQLVVHRDHITTEKFATLSAVPPESVVTIQGCVRSRPNHSKRPVSFYPLLPLGSPRSDLSVLQGTTGSIEVLVQDFIVLNPADKKLPFSTSDNQSIVRATPLLLPLTSRHQRDFFILSVAQRRSPRQIPLPRPSQIRFVTEFA
jgi:hypothetical protein